jgi:hypothetical protein
MLTGPACTRAWQEINDTRHYCHWWLEIAERRISAMNALLLILIAIAATVALVRGTIWLLDLVIHDGYGNRPAARRHHDDADTPTWRRTA